MKEIYIFLKQLKLNNNREWFLENKDNYLKSKKLFEDFLEKVIAGISKFDKSIAGVQTKESIFRIYRDVRFSHDKSPYKTHFGAFIVKGGKTYPRGGYYVHIEPDNSLLAGGIWNTTPPILKTLRQEIYDNAEEFLEIVENPELTKYYIHDDEKLKKTPPQFPADLPVSEWLKNKRFTPFYNVSDNFFTSDDAVDNTCEKLKLLYPLNCFVNYALEETLTAM